MKNSILQTGNTGNEPYNKGNSKTKKIILIMIIALLAIILVGGGIFAYTYFMTDTFLTEEQAFYKYISKNSEILEMLEDEDLSKYAEKIQKEAYSSNQEISIGVNQNVDEEMQKAVDEIQKHKIILTNNVDNANKYLKMGLNLQYEENDIIGGSLIRQNDYLGLKVNDIGLNPYIVLENNNLKQFAKTLGLSEEQIAEIQDKIDFDKISNEELFTDAELSEIKDRYLKAITDNLSEDMFSKNSQDDMSVYTLTINEEKGKAIMNSLIETLKNDDMLLNKLKQLYREQMEATEEEAQSLIDNIKTSLQNYQEELTGISTSIDTVYDDSVVDFSNDIYDDSLVGATEENTIQDNNEDENLYISVYVSKRNLVKTEVNVRNNIKIVLNKGKNNTSLEAIYLESNSDTETATHEGITAEMIAKINLEKSKTDNELSYILTIMQQENKELAKITLSYTGLEQMSNVGNNVLVNIDLSDMYNGEQGIQNQVLNTGSTLQDSEEQLQVFTVLSELKSKSLEDTYTSQTEFEINEKTIKEYMDKNELDTTVSKNEDGTYNIQSNTTGNIYTADSKGNLTNTELVENVQIEKETQEEEKYMSISLNVKGNTTFGDIQKQELTESNIYKVNDKTSEQLEKLFTQLGERISNKLTTVYKNTTIGQMIIK